MDARALTDRWTAFQRRREAERAAGPGSPGGEPGGEPGGGPDGGPPGGSAGGEPRAARGSCQYDGVAPDPTCPEQPPWDGAVRVEATAMPVRGLESLGTAGPLTGTDPEAWAFLDVETTGLRGGGGTWVFLVGIGRPRPDEGCLAVRQVVLADPGREEEFLAAVRGALAGATALVSFNGRSFDVPVLGDRFALARVEGLPDLPHWDLLPAARRLWGARPGACTLSALDEAVLGGDRRADLPGALAPSLYRAHLQGDGGALEPVLVHNRADLAALAGLAARWSLLVAGGPRLAGDAWEAYGLAREYRKAGELHRAAAAVEACLLRQSPGGLPRRRTAQLAAELFRRVGRFRDAAAVWEEVCRGPLPDRRADLALARLYEHRLRDYGAALAVVRRALARRAGGPLPADWRLSLQRRQQRLERRLSRAAAHRSGRPPRGTWKS